AIEIEVILLDVLAVIPLAVGQSEQPFLEDWIAPIPQREREAQKLAVVGDASEPVLTPSVGTVLRVIMSEVVPGVAVRAVVLAHRPPLALAQIRPPLLPGYALVIFFLQPLSLMKVSTLHAVPHFLPLDVSRPSPLCSERKNRHERPSRSAADSTGA